MKPLSRRALQELEGLQACLRQLALERNEALRIFAASRDAAVASAQREFWLEFAWLDQEYRIAVCRLAQFCLTHGLAPARQPAQHDHLPEAAADPTAAGT